MGYRSEVRSAIYGPKDTLMAFLTKAALIDSNVALSKFKESLTLRVSEATRWNDETKAHSTEIIYVLDLYGDSWKWYEDYHDVRAWHALLEEAEEFGLDYEFVRVGEETGDIDQRSTENAIGIFSVNASVDSGLDSLDESKTVPLPF